MPSLHTDGRAVIARASRGPVDFEEGVLELHLSEREKVVHPWNKREAVCPSGLRVRRVIEDFSYDKPKRRRIGADRAAEEPPFLDEAVDVHVASRLNGLGARAQRVDHVRSTCAEREKYPLTKRTVVGGPCALSCLQCNLNLPSVTEKATHQGALLLSLAGLVDAELVSLVLRKSVEPRIVRNINIANFVRAFCTDPGNGAGEVCRCVEETTNEVSEALLADGGEEMGNEGVVGPGINGAER